MIITLIILGLMILNIYDGYQDGLVYEFVRIISYIVGFILALKFTDPVGTFLNQFLDVDPVLLNGICFLIILVIAVIALKSLGRVINRATHIPVIHLLNAIGGAFVGAFVGYLIIFILLNVFLAVPSQWLQNEYSNSPVAMRIINKTPGTNNSTNEWLK